MTVEFTIERAGPRLQAGIDTIADQLADGPKPRTVVRQAVLQQTDLASKTFDNLVLELVAFGAITRRGARNSHLQLTTLGRRWLAHGRPNAHG